MSRVTKREGSPASPKRDSPSSPRSPSSPAEEGRRRKKDDSPAKRPNVAVETNGTEGAPAGPAPVLTRLGMSLLLLLSFQNCMVVLTMRYVRTLQGPQAHISSAVTCDEVIKFFVCLFLVFLERKKLLAGTAATGAALTSTAGLATAVKETGKLVFARDMWVMAVPAVLYAVQKQLLYHSIQHLPAAIYQVTNQLKVVTAAVFSIFLLGRSLSARKCVALGLLVCGVCLVQLSVMGDSRQMSKRANPTFGFVTGVGACITSGFAGVYTEMMLKKSGQSMWVRSAQLCVFCTMSSLIFSYIEQGQTLSGFWHGFTPITWAPILCESLGGVLTALVLKYADTVLKSFAIGLAIVLSTGISFVFFNFTPTVRFILGAPLVILSLFIYNVPAKTQATPTSTRAALTKKDQ